MTNDVKILLNESYFTIEKILFSSKKIFSIDLSWCNNYCELIRFIEEIEEFLKTSNLEVLKNELELSNDNQNWKIKIK